MYRGNAAAAGTQSNLNFVSGTTRANLVFVPVPSASNGQVCVGMFGAAGSSGHVLIDLVAYSLI